MTENKRTEIGEIGGEFGLIDKLATYGTKSNSSTIVGIGDDAAVLDRNDKEYTLISTDLLLEGIHFDLAYAPLKHLGYKAIAVNASDIAAMNGLPEQVTVSIAISSRFSVEAIEELYDGIKSACTQYKIDLVGGDTTSSISGWMISVTVIGKVDKDKVVYRNTAKVGDAVCVTGDFGGAFLGLNILQREKEVFSSDDKMEPQLDGKEYVVQRQLKPEARLDVIHELKDKKIVPTSMIDVSDGLASELFHICTKSKVGVAIYDEFLPKHDETKEVAFEFGIDPTTCVLNGGEDYELLFTVKKEDVDALQEFYDVVVIGEIKEETEGLNLVTKGKNVYPLQAQGWDHFKK